MRVSIGQRLFATMLLAMLAVAAVSMELIRWTLFDNFSERTEDGDSVYVGDLIDSLAQDYRLHHDWSFLPAGPIPRAAWLHEQLRSAREEQTADSRVAPLSSSLGDRIGLLDKDRHLLAGALANRLVITFASIDQVQRPILVDGSAVGYVVLARPHNPDDALAVAFLIERQDRLPIALALGVLLSALASALLAAHFRKPIRRLLDASGQLQSGNFDTRVTLRRSDELGELGQRFNHLAARLAEVESSRRQWVADTSHELRTPLSVLRAQMESMQDGIRTATPENLALMLRQVNSLNTLVDDLYELARADVGHVRCEKAEIDIWPLVCDVLGGFAEKFHAARLQATVGVSPANSNLRCDAEQMRRVMTNLLENSVRYTAAGGRVDISGHLVDDELHVVIDDSAPGVAEPSLARLGERFFRVDGSRSREFGGAGLGLALCRQILHAHDGRLEFAPSPLGGLRAIIALKRYAQ